MPLGYPLAADGFEVAGSTTEAQQAFIGMKHFDQAHYAFVVSCTGGLSSPHAGAR
jgi:hypothetical protein